MTRCWGHKDLIMTSRLMEYAFSRRFCGTYVPVHSRQANELGAVGCGRLTSSRCREPQNTGSVFSTCSCPGVLREAAGSIQRAHRCRCRQAGSTPSLGLPSAAPSVPLLCVSLHLSTCKSLLWPTVCDIPSMVALLASPQPRQPATMAPLHSEPLSQSRCPWAHGFGLFLVDQSLVLFHC